MKSLINQKKIKFEVEKLNINKDDIIVVRISDDYMISHEEYEGIKEMFESFNIKNFVAILPKNEMFLGTFTLKEFKKWSNGVIKKYKEKK